MANVVQQVISRAREVRVQPYWETKRAVAAATDVFYFITLPATADLGNMQVAGQFPAPRQFKVRGISVYTKSQTGATAVADVAKVLDSVFILNISDKEYLRVTGWMAAGGGGLTGAGALATQVWIQGGQALPYAFFKIEPNILIPMQQNFNVRQTFGAVAAPAAIDISVALWGIEERAVQ